MNIANPSLIKSLIYHKRQPVGIYRVSLDEQLQLGYTALSSNLRWCLEYPYYDNRLIVVYMTDYQVNQASVIFSDDIKKQYLSLALSG